MTAGFVLIAGFTALLVAGMPIAFALGASAIVGFLHLGGSEGPIQIRR